MNDSVIARLAEVRRRIEAAALGSGRDPSSVTLVAVSKTFGAVDISNAVAAGVTDLGETRVQEAASKKPDVPPATWHLIGSLQRNKARGALEVFDVIHTLDRVGLAHRLQYLLEENWPERKQPVLIEVNIGDEPQKAGVGPDEAHQLLIEAMACDRLEVNGLMAIPPFAPDSEASRPHFQALRRLRDDLQDRAGVTLPHLSMGMSQDFEIAIEEGATIVRVGTAIFGARG
jgi:pyridoxal phosphate enzyme (YggS family)